MGNEIGERRKEIEIVEQIKLLWGAMPWGKEAKYKRGGRKRSQVQGSTFRTRAKLKTQSSHTKCWFCHIIAKEVQGFRFRMTKPTLLS